MSYRQGGWKVRAANDKLDALSVTCARVLTEIHSTDFDTFTDEEKRELDEKLNNFTDKLQRVMFKITAKMYEEKVDDDA